MHYTIAICDDDAAASRYALSLAQRWAAARGHCLTCEEYSSAEGYLFAHPNGGNLDILLLDIEMGGINGVELARTLRKGGFCGQLVFITGYSDYIAQGYEVEALHYLMKPLSPAQLEAVLDRAALRLAQAGRTLLLELPGEAVRLPLREIVYLESNRNYVTVHAGKDYTLKRPLRELQAQLDAGFFRAGRSYLINLRRIRRVSRTEIFLDNGAHLPLPRGMYDPLNQAMIRQL